MPLVASVPDHDICNGWLYQPFEFAVMLAVPVTVGRVASIATWRVFGDSAFPALSVELKVRVWLESPITVNGPE